MKIGICINNVLRNHVNTLVHTYEKYTGTDLELEVEDINLFDLIPQFPIEINEKESVDFDPNSTDPYSQTGNTTTTDKTITPFDSVTLPEFTTNKEYVKNDEAKDVYELMYTYASLEIFGRADLVDPNAFNSLKVINNAIKDFGREIILINQESDKSKLATLFFLSKSGFSLGKVIFTDNTDSIWEHVDMLITDHPKLIGEKPDGKIVVKVTNKWNKDVPSDYEIDSIMDVTEMGKNDFLFT